MRLQLFGDLLKNKSVDWFYLTHLFQEVNCLSKNIKN